MSVEVLSVRGLRPECGKVDRDLWLWFCAAKRDSENYHGPRVTKRLVQAKAKQAFQAAGIQNFKASDGWYIRWLKRWHRVGLENAQKLNIEGNLAPESSSNSQVPKKPTTRQSKRKVSKSLNCKGSTGEKIAGNFTGPITYSSIHMTDSKNFNRSFTESSATLSQSINESLGSNSFSLTLSSNPGCQAGVLCKEANSNFADAFLTQEYNIQSEAHTLESAHIEEQFLPDNSSLLNLDDVTWNDLSDLSCFGRPLSSKTLLTSSNDVRHENLGCSIKSAPQLVKLGEIKSTFRGKGKLCEPQKSLGSILNASQNSASEAISNFGIVPINHVPLKKFSYGLKTSSLFNGMHVKNVSNTSQDVSIKLNCRLAPEGKVSNLHFNNRSLSHAMAKSASEACARLERISDDANKETFVSNLAFRESIGIANRENLSNHLVPKGTLNIGSYTDLINEDSVCGNFVQQDFEDVSVSSDFVNQLNDEHSLELNLGYGSENVPQRISRKPANESVTANTNFQDNCVTEQPVLNNFISLMPSVTSVESLCANRCTSPESGCRMSVEDDDLSSEENDYISKAVMLSMQEDDFSILNCDQSPFQGTISVVDENSQSECDKIKDLDEDMPVALSTEDSALDVQLSFPPPRVSEDDLMDREHVFYCGGIGANEKDMKRNTNVLQARQTDEQNVIVYQPLQGKNSHHHQRGLLPSHLVDEEHLVPDNMSHKVFSISEEKRAKLQDVLQISSSGDAVSSNNMLSSPVDGIALTREDFSLSSSVDGNVIVGGGNVFQISPSGEISLVENQSLFQISSSDDVSTLVPNQEIFLATSCNDVREVGSLSSTCLSDGENLKDPQNLIISESCSPTQNIDDTSSMYYLPCVSKGDAESDVVPDFGTSNVILNDSIPSMPDTSMELCSLDSHVGSFPEVTIANADSTTVLLSSSPCHLNDGNVTRLVALTSPNTFMIRNSSLLATQVNVGKTQVSISNLTLSPDGTDNLFRYNSVDQIGSSTSLLNCESTKENGFTSYDLQLVESVLSEQDDGPGIPPKLLKNNAACLTEKGNNTSKSNIDDNQLLYRRSSGDRYFPYFKEKVVEYATKHTAKEAARYFGVNVDTVTMWTRGKFETDSVVRNYPDQLMLHWLKRNRESRIVLTKEQIVEKALQLLKTPGSWVKDKSRWFHVWASRLADEEKKKRQVNNGNEINPLPMDCGDKKALYPDDFKVEVVLYAEQTSKNLASSIFNIARKRVFDWSAALKVSKKAQEINSAAITGSKQISLRAETLSQTVNDREPPSSLVTSGSVKLTLNSKGLGRAVTSVAVDQELWDWFCQQTAKKSKPKSREIRAKAVELFRAHNHDKIQCSHGWLKKWSLRYGIALRHEGDGDLLAWCLGQFDQNRNISHRDLLNHAQESLTGTHKSEFKASAGWLVRFCKRHRNLLSSKPGIEVEIPNALKHRVSQFRSHTQEMIHTSNISFSHVGCMDEVPLNFTSGGSRSRLLLRRSGVENCHATVILSCLADGDLLPPAVIFKGEGPMETITYGNVSLLVFYQQDCCMTTTIMQQWIDLVWNRSVPCPSILVADCYGPHCSDVVQEACDAANISLSIIPAGCSFKLQPLDLAISRLLEANIYNRWTRHFSASDQLSTCKRTSYSSNTDIGRWIVEAYSNLKETRKEAIRRSFLVTGLSCAPNGVEDHLIEDPSYMPFTSLFTSQN